MLQGKIVKEISENKKEVNMRRMEFKMERSGLVKEGEILPITESKLPTSYYYTLGRAYAMSANYTFGERLKTREGKVIEIEDTPKGFFVVMEFDEEEVE